MESSAAGTISRDTTILSVNDDSATRYLWSRILRDAGYQVKEADSGQAALRAVEEHRPHLVLLDVKLPDLDGFTVCEQLKTLDPSVPVLMVSAWFTKDDDFMTGVASGADGYLYEPTEDQKLLAMIYGLLRRYRSWQCVEQSAMELQRQNEALRARLQRLEVAHAQLQEQLTEARLFEEVVIGRELKLIEYEKEILALRQEVQSLKEPPRPY